MNFDKRDFKNAFLVNLNASEAFSGDVATLVEEMLVRGDGYMKSYIMTYPVMVRYFDCLQFMSKECLIRGSLMVYGWMPTTLRVNLGEVLSDERFLGVRNFLLECRKAKWNGEFAGFGGDVEIDIIEKLNDVKTLMNGSVVGMSKLLHFINPGVFPIIDSALLDFLKGELEKSAKKSVTMSNFSVVDYVNYVYGFLEFCDEVLLDEGLKESVDDFKETFVKQCNDRYGGDVYSGLTTLRAIELMYFHKARKDKKER